MIRLVPYWRSAWRLWSVRLSTLGTLLWGYFLAFPDAAVQVWAMMPAEFKSLVPTKFTGYITFAIFAMTLLSRLIVQQKAQDKIEEKMNEKISNGEAVAKTVLYKPAEK